MRRKRRFIRRLKIFLLFISIFFTIITFVVGSYAWYNGMNTLATNSFNIAVGASDGLELSLDGSTWQQSSLSISKNAIESAYTNNTNKWTDSLTPISTVGEVDPTYSRLKIFKNTSLTDSDGGVKLTASRVDNYTGFEADGYIAFDLFIRNGKEDAYFSESSLNDPQVINAWNSTYEDVFLSGGSSAYVSISGSATNYGAANSLRVGFFELGHLKSKDATVSNIQGIDCSTDHSCTFGNQSGLGFETRLGNSYNIWEPNAAKHAGNLVSYFNDLDSGCKNRDALGNYTTTPCRPIEEGASRDTYSIVQNIADTDNIDIYDGYDLNTYGNKVFNAAGAGKIFNLNTYKTSYATTTGVEKKPLIKLASNSVTKVRVYIWLEGQDIDNYDVATLNSTININFGFTKDRLGLNQTNNNAISNRTSSFEDDSWEKIKRNVQIGNISQYHVGDTKEVVMKDTSGNYKNYTVRLVNKTYDNTFCNNTSNSQTGCGFIVEFADIVENKKMNSNGSIVGGWPSSELYAYLQNDFYNRLPGELRNVIATTRVISSHEYNVSDNYVTNDKLYLLSTKEFNNPVSSYDTSISVNRTLDYYQSLTLYGYDETRPLYYQLIKYSGNNRSIYWQRSVTLSVNPSEKFFSGITDHGFGGRFYSTNTSLGIAPAFRISSG